ncbi:MAG: hypothetical protein EAX96_04115 [Candidatus Lokiarchaeota archaeon]|nr:hypothetical protein [Candidatus Lokiarchaeota archaeon]
MLDLEIKHSVKPYSLEMRSRESILNFKKKIGFIKGVKMTGNSKYWEGFSKDYILDLIIKSYSIKFESKDPNNIIRQLKNSEN